MLLLGEAAVPALREVMGSKNRQAAMLAKATIDAIAGKRKAFGYLVSELDLTQPLFGRPGDEPEWVAEAAAPYVDNPNLRYK
jgi:hypothetical protein